MTDTPLTPDERSDRRQAADDRASDNADRREVSDVRASDNADRRQVADANASAKADRREKTDRRRLDADRRGVFFAVAVIVVSLGVIGTGVAAYIVTDNAVEGLAATQRELAATQRAAAQNTARLDHLTKRLHASECGDAYLWLGILEASEVQEPGEPEPTEQDLKTRREFRAQQLATIKRLECPPPLTNGGTS